MSDRMSDRKPLNISVLSYKENAKSLMWQSYIFIQVFSRATSVNLIRLLCEDSKSVKYCKKITDFGRNVIIEAESHNVTFLSIQFSHFVKNIFGTRQSQRIIISNQMSVENAENSELATPSEVASSIKPKITTSQGDFLVAHDRAESLNYVRQG